MHTAGSLTDDLIRAGFQPSDTVLIHSSMKSIGEVEGCADTVLDVLMKYFGREGLLVFPALSYNIYQEEKPSFSVEDTPSVVGLLTEMFRHRPGVVRSLHPTHSVAAFGKDAAGFCAGHEKFSTPCARTSPWGRLYDRKAKILFIGTSSIGCCTFFHGVEEWLPVPGMFSKEPYNLTVRGSSGKSFILPSFRHIGSHNHFYAKTDPVLRKENALRNVVFGDARCFLMDACRAADTVTKLLKDNPMLFTAEWNEAHPDSFPL